MSNARKSGRSIWEAASITATAALGLAMMAGPAASAQNPQLQERVAEIRQASTQNKQLLAQYTWQEQQTVSIKGEVKKQTEYQVRLGPDGKQQKMQISPQQQSSNGRRERGLRGRVVEKKKAEFEDYAKQVAALAQSYAHPDPQRMQQLFQQGNITLGSGGAPGEVRMVIHNYLKQGDSVTIVFSREQKALQSINVASFLDNPQDAVTISAQYAQIPGGPNHVSTMTVNGVSKHLTVTMQNSNYQKM
jgi:hypothetical protein